MTGKVRHLLERNGRYSARVVIPKDLRPLFGGLNQFTQPLGADRRTALKLLPAAVAGFQARIAEAWRSVVLACHHGRRSHPQKPRLRAHDPGS